MKGSRFEPKMTRNSKICGALTGEPVYGFTEKWQRDTLDGAQYKTTVEKVFDRSGRPGDVIRVDGAAFRLVPANGRGCDACPFYCAGDDEAAALNWGVPCGLRRAWRLRTCNPVGDKLDERTIFEEADLSFELETTN